MSLTDSFDAVAALRPNSELLGALFRAGGAPHLLVDPTIGFHHRYTEAIRRWIDDVRAIATTDPIGWSHHAEACQEVGDLVSGWRDLRYAIARAGFDPDAMVHDGILAASYGSADYRTKLADELRHLGYSVAE
jgi:hypothetical protein